IMRGRKDDDVSDSREFANVVEAAPVVTVEITVVDSNKFVKKKGKKVRRQIRPSKSKLRMIMSTLRMIRITCFFRNV
ncbi:hypothetical protein Tco_0292958, partial [Tanacetum coccineum]